MSDPVTCPNCDGRGKNMAFVDFARGSRQKSGVREMDCFRCQGTGSISGEEAERIARGQAMREDRMRRGLTVREEAARLGMTPQALNALEHGREAE